MSELITDMNCTPLSEPFQTWAQLRRKECILCKGTKSYALYESFTWADTPEGHGFWFLVDYGKPMEPHPSWEPQEPLTMEDIFVGLK